MSIDGAVSFCRCSDVIHCKVFTHTAGLFLCTVVERRVSKILCTCTNMQVSTFMSEVEVSLIAGAEYPLVYTQKLTDFSKFMGVLLPANF